VVLTDRHRWAKVLTLVALLAALCGWYSWRATHQPTGYQRCMSDPVAHDGRLLQLSLWRVQAVGSAGYEIAKTERDVPVLGPSADLQRGDVVSVVGHFDAGRRVVVEHRRQLHPLRRAKSLLGVLGTLCFLIYAARSFRWRDGAVRIRA